MDSEQVKFEPTMDMLFCKCHIGYASERKDAVNELRRRFAELEAENKRLGGSISVQGLKDVGELVAKFHTENQRLHAEAAAWKNAWDDVRDCVLVRSVP